MKHFLCITLLLWPFTTMALPASTLHELRQQFLDEFSADAQVKGFQLDLIIDYNDNETFSTVNIRDGQWQVVIPKGLAEHPSLTLGGFFAFACHELGHLIGGAPFVEAGNLNSLRGSVEGQADYFTSLKCLPRLFQQKNWPTELSPPDIVKKYCQIHNRSERQTSCVKTIMASLDFVRFIEQDIGTSVLAQLDQKDPIEVPTRTLINYPKTIQCRLDTLLAGALCQADPSEATDDLNPNIGACSHGIGARPRCWFKPDGVDAEGA